MNKTKLIIYTENNLFESVEIEVLESIKFDGKILYFHKNIYKGSRVHPYHLSYLFVGDLWTETGRFSQEDSFKRAKQVVFIEKIENLPFRLKLLAEHKAKFANDL